MSIRVNHIGALLMVFGLLCSCTTTEREPRNLDDGLQIATPKSQGIDTKQLNSASSQIQDLQTNSSSLLHKSKRFSGIDSLLVSRGGRLVYERYFNQQSAGKPHFVASLGKSLISAMFGRAVDEGLIKGPAQSIYTLMPYSDSDIQNWHKGKESMSFHHLLTMSAGWQCDDFSDRAQSCINLPAIPGSPYKSLLDLPLYARPGESFRYNEGAPAVVVASINAASGLLPAEFFRLAFMQPMQLRNNLFDKQMLTSREMLKFGLLFLNKGLWNGQRLLSEEWVARSTSKQIETGSQTPGSGYGYYWWTREFEHSGTRYSGYYAAGNGGQFIIVIPALELVTVFTGSNYNDLNKMFQVMDIMKVYVLPSVINQTN